jgi:hypothetical protein
MNNFKKSLLAVALLAAGTGAANANVAVASNTLSEVYLSVYNGTETFNIDLGLTFGDLVTNIANTAFSQSYDLAALTAGSLGGDWSTYATNANTVYGLVAAGTAGKIWATGGATATKFAILANATSAVSNLTTHISTVNTAALLDNPNVGVDTTALNLSSRVLDSDVPNTGQHNQVGLFSDLNGGKSGAGVDIALGTAANFWYYSGAAIPVAAVQQWNLVGNTLTYQAAGTPAAVPLPAAVWMFGAGLMGVLRLNRRKSMAV